MFSHYSIFGVNSTSTAPRSLAGSWLASPADPPGALPLPEAGGRFYW